MSQYGKADYWNDRYSKDSDPFDWYQKYDALSTLFKKYLKPVDKILMVGCGNSRLSEDMHKDGFKNITNIDISNAVIKAMEQKSKDHEGMTYKTIDATNMPEFANGSFDAAVDKGTLDAILCGESSIANADKMLGEISRVLRPGGVFVVVTYGDPPTRLTYLEKPKYGWKVETQTIDKPKVPGIQQEKNDVHYIYIASKS